MDVSVKQVEKYRLNLIKSSWCYNLGLKELGPQHGFLISFSVFFFFFTTTGSVVALGCSKLQNNLP